MMSVVLRKRVVLRMRVVLRKTEEGRVPEVEESGQFILAGLIPRWVRRLDGRGKSCAKGSILLERCLGVSCRQTQRGIEAQAPDCFGWGIVGHRPIVPCSR